MVSVGCWEEPGLAGSGKWTGCPYTAGCSSMRPTSSGLSGPGTWQMRSCTRWDTYWASERSGTRVGLLRNPASETEAPDTHFTGPLAVEAFDAAGGTSYRGAKVPVENTGGAGSYNGHWRRTVFGTELMAPSFYVGEGHKPLSATTIQSLVGPRLHGRRDRRRSIPASRRRRRAGDRTGRADSVRGRHLERTDRNRRPGRTDRAHHPGPTRLPTSPRLAVRRSAGSPHPFGSCASVA